MKIQLLNLVGAAGLLIAATGTSHAITLGLEDAICEGPSELLPDQCFDSSGMLALPTFNDGPQIGGTPPVINITFSGSGSGIIYGGIRGVNDTQFQDIFELDGTGSYRLTLTALNFTTGGTPRTGTDEPFDATWTIGGFSGVINNSNTVLSTVLDLSSPTLFTLDAAGGIANNSVMEYQLDIEAIPLPAAGWLLLAGLGGFAALKRRKQIG